MKYRSRMDIVAEMLNIAQGGAIKTRIMYRAFLSFPQLKEYLAVLMERGLLEYEEKNNEYVTTESGKRFLKVYREIGQLIFPKGSKVKSFAWKAEA